MKRRWIMAALSLMLLLGASAAGAYSSGVHSQAVPAKLTCKITGVNFGAARVTLAPKSGCYVGKKAAPSSGKWTAKSYDITAASPSAGRVAASVAPCYYGLASGAGKSLAVPSPAKYIRGGPSYVYPQLYQVSFTLSAKWGKQKASATRTVLKRTPDSPVLCGAPPKIEQFSGPAGACVWSDFPDVVNGAVSTRNARVACPVANRVCVWKQGPATQQDKWLVMGYEFVCGNGFRGKIAFQSGYSTDGGKSQTCSIPYMQGTSTFVFAPYGPGMIYVYAYVVTTVAGDNVRPGQMNTSPTAWWGTSWFPVNGSTAPC